MSNDTPTGPLGSEPDDAAPENNAPENNAPETDVPINQPSAADDAPTERFDSAADAADADAATRLLPPAGEPIVGAHVPIAPAVPTAPPVVPTARPVAPTTPPGSTEPPKKNRSLLYWLIGIGAVLLIAVIVLLITLFSGSDDQPEPIAQPTQSATPPEQTTPSTEPSPDPTPTPEPTQAPESPTFATFSAPTTANCEEGDDKAPLSFSWSSSDAVRAYLGVGTQNAAVNPTVSDLPPTATYTDLDYDCTVASQVYTVTLEDEAGALASKTVTITK